MLGRRHPSVRRETAGRLLTITGSEPNLALDETDHEQEYHCTDDGVYDTSEDTSTDHDPKPRQQPTSDHRADDANHNVANETKTVALHDLSGSPSRDSTDDQPDDQCFNRHSPA